MHLYLVQHAEAKGEAEDPLRGLTDRGIADIKKVAAFVARSGVKGVLPPKAARILHSGKKRAEQTAQILADELGLLSKTRQVMAQTDGLSPADDPNIWAGRIKGIKEDTMLVGHLPHLSRLASVLLCGDAGKNVVTFVMAGVVCLKKEENGWSVKWMITPEIV